MPTGYTDQLEKMGYDVKKWLKEGAIRAMGLCMSLRDAPGGMTEEQIRDAFKKQSGESYHGAKLREAEALLDVLERRSSEEWTVAWSEDKHKALQENGVRTKEFNAKKESHIKAANQIRAMLERAENRDAGEVVIGTLRFALEQLDSAFDFDYGTGPYLNENETITLDNYIEKTLKQVRWDANYHSQYEAKDKTRTRDTAKEYDKFTRWVDAFAAGAADSKALNTQGNT